MKEEREKELFLVNLMKIYLNEKNIHINLKMNYNLIPEKKESSENKTWN